MTNEISVKFPSQFLTSKITTSFDKLFDPLSMNSRIEVEKFKPGTTFEKTIIDNKYDINDIKDNNLKIIASAAINISGITFFVENFDPLSMNNNFEREKSNLNQHLKRLLMRSLMII